MDLKLNSMKQHLKVRNTLIMALFFIIIYGGFSQQKISEPPKDSLLFDSYMDSIQSFFFRNYEKGLRYSNLAYQYALEKDDQYRQARAISQKAWFLTQIGGEANMNMAEELLKKAVITFREYQDESRLAKCNNRLSILYKERKNYPKALENGLKNLEYHQNLKKNNHDVLNLAIAYNSVANIYLDLELFEEAIKNHKKAYELLKTKDLPQQYASLANIGLDYHLQGDWEQCITYLEKALAGFEQNNQVPFIGVAYMNIADAYDRLEKFQQAIGYAKKALKFGQQGASLGLILSNLSLYYLHGEQLDSALYYSNKVLNDLEFEPSLSEKMRALNVKSKVFEKKGNSKMALVYSREANRLDESLEALKNVPKTTEILLAVKEEEKQNQVATYKNKLSLRAKSFWAVLAISLLLIGIILLIYRINVRKVKLNKDKLLQEVQEFNITKDRLQRSVTTANAGLAIKNDLLIELQQTLDEITRHNHFPQELKGQVSTVQNQIQDNLSLSKLWKTFFIHFESVHPEFASYLVKEYSLSPTELKICCFLKMNLSNKEIAHFLNIEYGSIRKSVYRIKKKLSLPKEKRVFEFLHSI
ncbi:MAG: tetratricopeptide repeat protein [Bacteroidota bacterium]